MPATVQPIPLDVLFGNPERASVTLAPDGHRWAYRAPVDGVMNVWVGTRGGDDAAPVTDARERGISSYFWAYDDRHLLYLQDDRGDENWRLHAVDLATGERRDLTPFDGIQARMIAADREHPHELLVGLNRDNPALHDAYRLDLRTGELELVEKNPGFLGMVADKEWVVRAAATMSPDGSLSILVRDSAAEQWRPLLVAAHEDAATTAPMQFTADGSGLYVLSSVGSNAAALLHVDVATGAREVLAQDPGYDVTDVVMHPDTREVEAVAFLKQRLEYQLIDESIAPDFKALEALSPGDLHLIDRDRDDRTWLVSYTVDAGPVAYYLWDRDGQEATFLLVDRPELSDHLLAQMEPFSFTARDGLKVEGYLTFPPGVERRDLPAVLNVHGGPWARDDWGFHPEAQWLANRGYVCVQVNFRGSTGYGKDFVNAGDREWGGKMHDDLLDAVDHIVSKGWVDRTRVAIYGGSYGGYAALVGAAFTPEVFRCAVDIVGPSNLITLIGTVPPYWAPMVAQFHNRVGNPETESDFLRSRSPLNRVDEITIPVMVVQGANDPRVKQSEAEQIVAAMREHGIPHEYLLFEDEGHGLTKPENRLRFYAATESFLAEHLARVVPAGLV